SKDEFKALFPHDPYKDENNPNTWEKGEQVLKKSFDTGKSKDLDLGNMKKWQTGLYKIELVSQDKFGQAVKDQLLVTIFDSKNKSVLDNTLFAASLDKKAYQIGNTVEVSLASAAKNLIVYVEIEKNKTLVSNQKVLLNNEVKTVKIPVDAADLGGFVIHLYYTIYNHFGYQKLDVLVPYPKTDLDIETRTFRDKLQPGQDETWSFKIKGPKGEQVSAELLASMYDASLDQFKPHAWSFDPIYQPIYYSAISKNGRNSFGSGEFISIYLREQFNRTRLLNISQDHEEWNWYGLSFRYGRNYLARGYADGIEVEADNLMATAPMEAEDSTLREEVAFVSKSEKALTYHSLDDKEENDQGEKSESIQVRKNLQETAFFFPQLQTDNKGNVTFSFTSPEALTKWKLQLLAHTKDLNSSVKTLETVTQKELMVIPN
ncbi:MAG: alpha-2-macroglobulin, partial [Mangrovimonas sp.]|nr:alpha-2-macroglobulin [Mangrovimonas sp.]